MVIENTVKTELRKASVFRDETKLSIDFIPNELPHRDAKMRKLTRIFKALVENPGGSSKRIIMTGGSGTGKTATVMRFGQILQEIARERGINLHYAHVDCHLWRSESMILSRIIQTFSPKFPKRGFNVPELWHILTEEILKKKGIYLLLTLDNFDFSLSEYPQLIYDLTRVSGDALNSSQRISFIIIAQNDSFKKRLDPSIHTTFQCSTIPFEKYTNLQLDDILQARIQDAFDEGTVLEDAKRLVADFAAETGDCRYALELLWLAGKYADEENAVQISAEQVRRAAANIHPHFRREIVETLSFQNQLLLLAICTHLESTQKGYLLIGDCETTYQKICENLTIEPYKYSQVWVSVQWMADTTDLISREVSALGELEGRAGRTTIIRLNYPLDIIKPVLEKEIDETVKIAIKNRDDTESHKRRIRKGKGKRKETGQNEDG